MIILCRMAHTSHIQDICKRIPIDGKALDTHFVCLKCKSALSRYDVAKHISKERLHTVRHSVFLVALFLVYLFVFFIYLFRLCYTIYCLFWSLQQCTLAMMIFHTIFGLIFMHALVKKPLDTTRHERLCRTQLQACLKSPIRTCLLVPCTAVMQFKRWNSNQDLD